MSCLDDHIFMHTKADSLRTHGLDTATSHVSLMLWIKKYTTRGVAENWYTKKQPFNDTENARPTNLSSYVYVALAFLVLALFV